MRFRVQAEVAAVLHELDRLLPLRAERRQRLGRGLVLADGLERLGRLELFAAIQDGLREHIFLARAHQRLGRRLFLHRGLDGAADEAFAHDDVLGRFTGGPALGRGLPVPLRVGESFDRFLEARGGALELSDQGGALGVGHGFGGGKRGGDACDEQQYGNF
jgi:hypothetical protein